MLGAQETDEEVAAAFRAMNERAARGEEMDARAGDAGLGIKTMNLDGIEVLFLDSISTLFRHGRENEAESWAPAQDWALRLRRRGVSVVFIHHEGKGGAQRGTSRREDVLDSVLHLVRPANYQTIEGARFEIHFEKARGLFGDDVKAFEAALSDKGWTTRDIEDVKLAHAKELYGIGLTVRDVAEELKTSRSTAQRLRAQLVENGDLREERK